MNEILMEAEMKMESSIENMEKRFTNVRAGLFKRELNVDAAFLRELQNNDIPILWRPFHEMNGNWFWVCSGT